MDLATPRLRAPRASSSVTVTVAVYRFGFDFTRAGADASLLVSVSLSNSKRTDTLKRVFLFKFSPNARNYRSLLR